MWPIVTDRVTWSVGLTIVLVRPTKRAEPVKMPFGLRTRVGAKNHVLDGGPPSKGAILKTKMAAYCKA